MLADGADASLTIAVSEWDSLASPFSIRCTDCDTAVADGSGWHREPCASVPDISGGRVRMQSAGMYAVSSTAASTWLRILSSDR